MELTGVGGRRTGQEKGHRSRVEVDDELREKGRHSEEGTGFLRGAQVVMSSI